MFGDVGEFDLPRVTDPPIQPAGDLGILGCVLRDVAGDCGLAHAVRLRRSGDIGRTSICSPQRTISSRPLDPSTVTDTRAAARPTASASRCAVAHAVGAVSGPSGPSSRIDRVDMHDAAGLEFRDLGVRDADLRPQRSNAQTRQRCKFPRQVRDGPAPQGAECSVPDRGRLVVVAVGAERLSDPGVTFSVTLETRRRNAVLALAQRSRWGRHRSTRSPRTTRRWTAPNDGAVNVAKTTGCEATDVETPFSSLPVSPAATRK